VRGLENRLLSREDMDVACELSVSAALQAHSPWAVVNAAGYVRVDQAESDSARCYRENSQGPAVLAEACHAHGVRLLTFSSDLVFDGAERRPYVESDPVSPLGIYGLSKARAEAEVVRLMPEALIIRTSAFFGPWDDHDFLALALRTIRTGRVFSAAADMVVSPTYVPELVQASLDLLLDGERGIWHLANEGALTWAEFARRGALLMGLDVGLVSARPVSALSLAARRPAYSALGTERGLLLGSIEHALNRWAREAPQA
jgi:dTDP-4-dehydrorhamnose reductase